MERAMHLPEVKVQQPAGQSVSTDALVIAGASGVAIPVSQEWSREKLRDLVSEQTIKRLSGTLGEREPTH
jgi:hypothetical protein